MCEKHNLPFIGTVCGEGYCSECSLEYILSLTGPNPSSQKHAGYGKIEGTSDGHKLVWTKDAQEIE